MPTSSRRIGAAEPLRGDLGGPLAWDIGFLVFGALLRAGGALLARPGERIAKAPA